MHNILTLDEAAEYLHLPKETLENEASQARLPGRRIDGNWHFPKTALDAWLRGPDSQTILLQQAGAFADDESLEQFRDARHLKMTFDGRQAIGRYIVIDSKICHGKPTIRGTRIMVADVLEMVADGMDWGGITETWGGKVSKEAIAEIVQVARQAFLEHGYRYAIEEPVE